MTTRRLHLGDFVRSSRQRGRSGLPVLSVTMDEGLVHRETLEPKTSRTPSPDLASRKCYPHQ